jgi:FKBP-type peptidyl-prolyl cis-trans isomerase
MRATVALLVLIAIAAAGCGGTTPAEPGADQPADQPADMPDASTYPGEPATGEVQTTASGLQYIVMQEGSGDSPTATSNVVVHYTGYLLDGTQFDSSVGSGAPAEFNASGVITGWTEGLQLMQEGGKTKFIIPPDLGYGAQGYPPLIPPDATLVFDLELIEVR